MRLLLFDIDGTLIRVNRAGRTAIAGALSPLADRPIATDAVSFSGRTDPNILQDILAHNGLPTTPEMVETAIERYVQTATETLNSETVELLSGVANLLEQLHAEADVHLGLVTGNVERVARQKLSAHGFLEYFPFGAFGSDHGDRNRLPPLAVHRAREYTGHSFLCDEHVSVIGDTVQDIRCARAAGARAIAVATGRAKREELAVEKPDLLLDSLEIDADRLLHG